MIATFARKAPKRKVVSSEATPSRVIPGRAGHKVGFIPLPGDVERRSLIRANYEDTFGSLVDEPRECRAAPADEMSEKFLFISAVISRELPPGTRTNVRASIHKIYVRSNERREWRVDDTIMDDSGNRYPGSRSNLEP